MNKWQGDIAGGVAEKKKKESKKCPVIQASCLHRTRQLTKRTRDDQRGGYLKFFKMTILREKVTRTQGGINEAPDSEKSSLMTRLASRPLIIPVSSTSQLGESMSKMVESSGISPIFPPVDPGRGNETVDSGSKISAKKSSRAD